MIISHTNRGLILEAKKSGWTYEICMFLGLGGGSSRLMTSDPKRKEAGRPGGRCVGRSGVKGLEDNSVR